MAELFAPVRSVTMMIYVGIALDDLDRPLPDAVSEIHRYELHADGASLLRMSRRRDSQSPPAQLPPNL